MTVKEGSLRLEYLPNPLGIDVRQPRFSWELQSDIRGANQSAYQILVSSSPERLAKLEGDCWDSGKVLSSDTGQIHYEGSPLVSDRRYYWTVRVWDDLGRESKNSKAAEGEASAVSAWFGTGLFEPADWLGAQWIAWRPQDVWKAEWDVRKQKEASQPPQPGDGFPFKTQSQLSIWELYPK